MKSQIKGLLLISLFCPKISVHHGFENPSAARGACLAFVQLRRNKRASRGPSFLLEEGWRKSGPLKGTAGMRSGNRREEKRTGSFRAAGGAQRKRERESERFSSPPPAPLVTHHPPPPLPLVPSGPVRLPGLPLPPVGCLASSLLNFVLSRGGIFFQPSTAFPRLRFKSK